MVSYNAKLDSRTKQDTHLESLRVTVPEIWPGKNRGGQKSKKKKSNKRIGW